MDDAKSALKFARDAIDKNDFNEAIKHCKCVLKRDKNNYMALVMLGVALQDSEQAPLAFRKAIALKDDKAFAWQGLSNYYEKQPSEKYQNELMETYKKLFTFENSFSKFAELCDKVYTLGITSRIADCGDMLLNQLMYIKDDENKSNKVKNTLVKMLSELDCSAFNNSVLSLFEKMVREPEIIETLNNKLILNFIKCLCELKGFETAVSTYTALKPLLKHDMFSVECWTLETYCKMCIMDDWECYLEDVAKMGEDVLRINPKLSIGLLTKAVLMLQQNEVSKALNVSRSLLEADTDNNVLLPIILAKCCVRLQRWLEAELLAMTVIRRKNDGLLQASKILLISLAHQDDADKCQRAFEIAEETGVKLTDSEYKALFIAYIQLNEFQKAQEMLTKFENSQEYPLLQAILYKSQGEIEMCISVLEKNKHLTPQCFLPLGKVYLEQKQYQSALIPLLQAAKFDPNNFEAFACLGDYYKVYDANLEKAKKCYLKAFNLNPECSRAGKQLSSIYRNLENWDDNFQFLKNITSSRGSQESWCWLELGLHHLALDQWDDAILHLRTFVRWNPQDTEAWESLADAYYSRGSFTSALKCYKQATELDDGRKYSFVQIGSIQYILGEYTDALKTYISIDDQSFLPALKGMAEVKVALANQYLSQNLYGACQESAQQAIKLISLAIIKENQFSCLWNILSNAISIITKLPSKYCWLYIDAQFSGQEDIKNQVMLKNKDVYLLAIRCFCRTINLSSSKCHLYFELAIVYLDYYKMFGDIEIIQKAFSAAKMCLELEQSEWQYWNLLGVICTCEGIKKYSLAQHCLIKAIQLDFSNAMIWSNLGVLYFHMKEEMLAHHAFSKGQQFDPLYLQSWIGQALLAERWSGFELACDLFRHSSQMGFHKESCLGYAESVCTSLSEPSDEIRRKAEYYIEHMHAIPTACDLMACLNEYENANACSLNIYGVLLEKMGLLHKAANIFESALHHVDEEYRDIVLLNLGRILYRIGEYERSIDTFKSLSETTLNSACGLALAFYKVGNYEKSMSVYSTALQWLAERDRDRSDLLVAMACMAYMKKEVHDAKTLLFQCIQINCERPSFYALQAAFALGILLSDDTLSKLVMMEIQKYKNDNEFIEPVAFLESYSMLQRKSPVEAMRILSNYIHILPSNPKLWEYLSKFCIIEENLNAYVASKSAQKVVQLNQDCNSRVKYYIMVSVSEMLLGNYKTSLKFVQNAIHSQPDIANNWVFLKNIMNHHLKSH